MLSRRSTSTCLSRIAALGACIVFGGLAAAGCGSSSTGGGGGGTQSAATQSAAGQSSQSQSATSQAAATGAKKTVAFVIGEYGLPWYHTAVCGAQAAAKAENVNLKVYGPTEYDPTQEINTINSAELTKPDGWVITPVDAVALNSTLSSLAAKAPLITFDGIPSIKVGLSNVIAPTIAGGAQAAQTMAKELGGRKGYVLVLGTKRTTLQTYQRDVGFINEMKKIAPNVTLSPTLYQGSSDTTVAAQDVSNVLSAHPDLVGIYAPAEDMVDGSVAAMASAHKSAKDVVIVGWDPDPTSVQALKRGAIAGLVLQDPYGEGFTAVSDMAKVLNGTIKPSSLKYTQTTAMAYATPTNINSPQLKKLLNAPVCNP